MNGVGGPSLPSSHLLTFITRNGQTVETQDNCLLIETPFHSASKYKNS